MSHTVNLEEGLACSRWAPRNSRGHHNSTQVWTRTTQLPKPTSTSTSISISISTSTSSNSTPRGSFYPDLGLPYEVQHFILETMRRILEEGSYQFASRVVPHLLSDRGWTCSELVELSMWRDTLPNAVSSAVLNMNSSYSLQRALIDAVRVRNAATHRHLCNNFELRKMAKQAEELMRIYGDIGRRLKFECLREELEEWDGVKAGGDEKRRTLETALKSISDRPMETMDWTPNSLSLEEITIDEHEVYVADEMEIDEIL
ncbi:hypothetical protein EJ08DRAFT_672241 [Tothia fuscella]|uniref:Uncharacterized protein n=1 Tax=Tothia fuscella TaxID=1048955 RepID=A0A9P4TUA3_9PEZI|nr:hypothetical protein EJ08DRAFT_672241 [Tothia fuscella]